MPPATRDSEASEGSGRPFFAEGERADPRFAVRTIKLSNADDLRQAVDGADLKIVQLAPGSFDGALTHVRIGELGLSTGEFELSIRARG